MASLPSFQANLCLCKYVSQCTTVCMYAVNVCTLLHAYIHTYTHTIQTYIHTYLEFASFLELVTTLQLYNYNALHTTANSLHFAEETSPASRCTHAFVFSNDDPGKAAKITEGSLNHTDPLHRTNVGVDLFVNNTCTNTDLSSSLNQEHLDSIIKRR